MLLFYLRHLGSMPPVLQVDHHNPECPENVANYFNINEAFVIAINFTN